MILRRGLTLAQMWERYYTENFGTIRQHDIKKTCFKKQIELIMIITYSWHEVKHPLVSVNTYIIVAKNKFIEGYLQINENSFKSKELLNQHDDEKEEPISLDLKPLKIKNALLKNENRICFPGKEKEGIKKLSRKIQQEMDSYKKEPISIFSSEKEVVYNPESNKLIYMIKYNDEMITIPDIGNTQAYSDDESSKATKIAHRMHNLIVNKTVLKQKAPAPGIKCKSKYTREIDREKEEENEFMFSDNEWMLEDNG
jgi:hypothetical protein